MNYQTKSFNRRALLKAAGVLAVTSSVGALSGALPRAAGAQSAMPIMRAIPKTG